MFLVSGSIPKGPPYFASVAQLDRVAVFETEGWEFESLRRRQLRTGGEMGTLRSAKPSSSGFDSHPVLHIIDKRQTNVYTKNMGELLRWRMGTGL